MKFSRNHMKYWMIIWTVLALIIKFTMVPNLSWLIVFLPQAGAAVAAFASIGLMLALAALFSALLGIAFVIMACTLPLWSLINRCLK